MDGVEGWMARWHLGNDGGSVGASCRRLYKEGSLDLSCLVCLPLISTSIYLIHSLSGFLSTSAAASLNTHPTHPSSSTCSTSPPNHQHALLQGPRHLLALRRCVGHHRCVSTSDITPCRCHLVGVLTLTHSHSELRHRLRRRRPVPDRCLLLGWQ